MNFSFWDTPGSRVVSSKNFNQKTACPAKATLDLTNEKKIKINK
jgi:hypothetical protein